MGGSERQAREQAALDRMVLEVGGEHGSAVPGLVFRLPRGLTVEGRGETDERPGIYFAAQHPNKSPTARLRYDARLLSVEEALRWAAYVDEYTDGCARPGVDGIRTHVELVERWYAALARGLDDVIEQATERRSQLRELRAALTGRSA